MLTSETKERLVLAGRHGSALDGRTLKDRITALDQPSFNLLANFAILGWNLGLDELSSFFHVGKIDLPKDALVDWLSLVLESDLLILQSSQTGDLVVSCPPDLANYFQKNLPKDRLGSAHRLSAEFFLWKLSLLASELNYPVPAQASSLNYLLQPNGFLFQVNHLPQYQEFHAAILNFSLGLYRHLFEIRAYQEAGRILNDICLSLARRGDRKLARDLLFQVSVEAKGLTGLLARANLAILLREDHNYPMALKINRHILPALLLRQAYAQLARVLTEMAACYRQQGSLAPSAILLNLSILLDGLIRNRQDRAIARSQLASTYQFLNWHRLASRTSALAVEYFRGSGDLVGLGRSLLTRGNIYNSRKLPDRALACFKEALEIAKKVNDPAVQMEASGGKARSLILSGRFDEAKAILEETISLRKRNNDHNVGLEYQNMGVLFEQQGKIPMALGWYQKALAEFERYIPHHVGDCEDRIHLLKRKLAD